jgi:hypothetical protein
MDIKLFSKAEVHKIPWTETADGRYAKEYLLPLMIGGSNNFIDNVNTEMFVLIFNNKVIPLNVSDDMAENCYVCSPLQHYIDYSIAELITLDRPVLAGLLKLFLLALRKFLRFTRINRVVYINNWLLSTNLYIDISKKEYRLMLALVKKKFPGHAIIFRSLNEATNHKTMVSLGEIGFKQIASRQLYMTDIAEADYKKRRDVKADIKLLNKSKYTIVDGQDLDCSEYPRLLELYNQLYLEKYFQLNPHFTVKFIETGIKSGYLSVKVLKINNKIDGVIGYFSINNVMTCPLLGYDLKIPVKTGLYRMLSLLLLLDAENKGIRFLNQSSGAAEFKRSRGAKPFIEYAMYYTRDLPVLQRSGWAVLKTIINGIAIPLLKYYKL